LGRNHRSVLCHPNSSFTSRHIKNASKILGLSYKESLETHIWIYELHSQIQKRAGNRCVLKGGASAQLYLPIDCQRCTADLDCATDLSSKELLKIMYSIKDDFYKNSIHCSYIEYIPRSVKLHGRTIPMMTFIFDLSFKFSKKKWLRHPGIKIDFLFLDLKRLHKTEVLYGETLGLNLSYTPIAIDKYSTISDKLITLASKSLGLDKNKLEGIYKNIYDLYWLINTYNDLETFKTISLRIKESLSIEIEMKNGTPVTIDKLLEDILCTIYDIATVSLLQSSSELPFSIVRFKEEHLQKEFRDSLNTDMWSVMSLYLYIWVFSLKTYICNKDYSKLEGLNTVIDQYNYYLSLIKNQRRIFKRELKQKIISKDPLSNLEGTGNVLRLLYLDYILSGMRPTFLKTSKLT